MKIVINILILCICNFCYSQNLKAKVCFQPIFSFAEICLDSNGKFETKVGNSFITPIGKFKIQASYSPSDKEYSEWKEYSSYSTKAVTRNNEIRFVEIENEIEIPKYQYKVYLKYDGYIYYYEIKNCNELIIETDLGSKSRFKASIVEIELAENSNVKIIYNGIDSRKIQPIKTNYPKRIVTDRRANFDRFKKDFMYMSTYNSISIDHSNSQIFAIPRDNIEIEYKVLTTNALGETVSTRTDCYYKNNSLNRKDKIMSVWKSRPREIKRIEIYYNKSFYDFISRDSDSYEYSNFMGINIFQLFSYLRESGIKNLYEDVITDLTTDEIYSGFSTNYDNDTDWRIGIYSRFENDISDMIAIFPEKYAYGNEMSRLLSNKDDFCSINNNFNDAERTISEYLQEMRRARILVDDLQLCDGIKKMVELGSLIDGEESDLYSKGHKISLIHAIRDRGNLEIVQGLWLDVLKEENEKYYAITYARDSKSTIYTTWESGYTRAEASKSLLSSRLRTLDDELEKGELLKTFAIQWYDFSWRILYSSKHGTYADWAVEQIYFELKLNKKQKENLLEDILRNISGSGKGNAYYCLFLLYEYDSDKTEIAKFYLRESIKIFENLSDEPFHRQMLDLAKSKYNRY